MADKILMNKNSLAALKTELRDYRSALPVFEMKEQQLKEYVQAVEGSISRLQAVIDQTMSEIMDWVAVMSEPGSHLSEYVKIEDVITESKEVSGVTIIDFVDIRFEEKTIDVFKTPMWVDAALEVIKDQKTRQVILLTELDKLKVLREELAEARRMKNALKEVFIPEAQKNIRKIEIYLGDVERLAIGCAKLVKKKKHEKILGQ